MINPGTKIGHYLIRSSIGAGGMGEVYLAEDNNLDRNIAIKVLPPDVASHKDRMRRFVQEAKASAALNHPTIAHIYEIGEADGLSFIAMEFVDGETLGQVLHAGGLDLPRVLRYLQHVAEGLAKAHSAGIVHRDLKPDNIMITRDGHVKILDFGLAKLLAPAVPEGSRSSSDVETAILQQQSTPGTVLGTAGYMSPEQAQGKVDKIDHRSDIFSFGCILYECVTGQRAFHGVDAVDTLNKIIRAPYVPVSELYPLAPADLQKIIRRCLAKDREERFQSIKDVAIELKELRRELAAALDTTTPPLIVGKTGSLGDPSMRDSDATAGGGSEMVPTRLSSAEYIVTGISRHKIATAVASSVLLVAAALGIWFFSSRTANAAQIESIAVMPFLNASGNGEMEYLSDGITESLINSLSQLPKLSVKARSSVFRYKGKDVEPQQVATDLNVQAVLNGRVTQRSDSLVISLDLVDALTGNQIWGEQYARKVGDIAALQSEIARDVSQKLRAKLTGADESRVVQGQTQNSEAYQLYLQGRYNWNKRTNATTKKAIDFFQKAIEKDPGYAFAYVGLAEAHLLTDEPLDVSFPRAKAAALKALEIDPTLGEPHVTLASYKANYEHQYAAAEAEYRMAIELNPNYPTAYHWYAECLTFQGRFQEALAQWKKAMEVDPFSLAIGTDYALEYLYFTRQYEEAEAYLKKLIELDPAFVRTHGYLAAVYERMGRYEDAINEHEKKAVLEGMDPGEIAKTKREISDALKSAGPAGYWSKALDLTTQEIKKGQAVPYLALAHIHNELGNRDETLKLLEKANEHKEDLSELNVAPDWDSLRDDPRFADVLRRIRPPG